MRQQHSWFRNVEPKLIIMVHLSPFSKYEEFVHDLMVFLEVLRECVSPCVCRTVGVGGYWVLSATSSLPTLLS